jgi:hypothetical protein
MLIPFIPNGDVELMYKNVVFMKLLILAKVIDKKKFMSFIYEFYAFVLYLPNGDVE